MSIKIGAFGYGVGSIFAAGTILLAALSNPAWIATAGLAVLCFVAGKVL